LSAQSIDDVPLPWEGLSNEDEVKKRFLELSQNPNVFLEDAPVEITADFGPLAQKLLQHDENLKKHRYSMVPKKLSEERFWTNYLYRVSLLVKIINEEAATESNKPAEQPQSSTHIAKDEEKNQVSGIAPKNQTDTGSPDKTSEDDESWEKELLSAEFDMVKETTDESWEEDLNDLLEACKTDK